MPVFKRNRAVQMNSSEGSSSEDENLPRKNSKQKTSRAEKSRCAAKMRRDKEGVELARLSALLPFSKEIIAKLDKGSILRLTIGYLQMKEYTKSANEALLEEIQVNKNEGPEKMEVDEGDVMLDALNGFLIFVNKKGKVLYVSDHVCEQLGLDTFELIGRGIFEHIHPDDQREFAKQFMNKPPRTGHLPPLPSPMEVSGNEPETDDEIDPTAFVKERLFYIRMKCHVTKKGSKVKQTGYVLTQWSGRLKLKSGGHKNQGIMGMMGIVRPMQSAPLLEIRLDGNMFMSRHQLDMTFTFCDPRISSLIGYDPTEVIGRTAYQFHNPMDACKIQNCHSNLIVKGTSVSKYYRFLGKLGEWVWMQTRATIVYNTSNEPQYVVCMNYVVSQEEGKRYLMMEQEEQGEKDLNCGGFIDVTNMTGESMTKKSSSCKQTATSGEGSGSQIHSPISPGSSQLSSGYESSSPCPQHHSPVPVDEISQSTVSCSTSSNPLTNVNPTEADFLASVASTLADVFPGISIQTQAGSSYQSGNSAFMTGYTGNQNPMSNQMSSCNAGFPSDILSDNLDSFDLDAGTLQWLEDPGNVTQSVLDELTTQTPSVDSVLPFASTDTSNGLVSSTSNPTLSSTSESFTNMSHILGQSYPLVSHGNTDMDVEMIDAFTPVTSFKQTLNGSDVDVNDDQANNSILMSLLGVSEAQQNVQAINGNSKQANGKSTQQGSPPKEKENTTANIKGNISFHMLPPGLLGVTTDTHGNALQSTNTFAFKFAENAATQAMNQTIQQHSTNTGSLLYKDRNGLVPNLHQSAAAVVSTEHSYFRTEAVTTRASSPDSRQGSFQQSKSNTQTFNSVRQPRLSSFVSPSPQIVNESQISSPTISSTSAVQSLLVSNQPIKDYKRPDLNQTSHTRGHHHQPHSTTNNNGHRHKQHHRHGNSSVKSNKYFNGFSNGHSNGHTNGFSNGHLNAHSNGHLNGHSNSHSNGVRQNNITNKTLLEKMLLSQEPLNPNQGSDRAFSEKQFSEKISQLNIGGLGEPESPLLKRLLTGEIDKQGVRRFEERVIETRKQSAHKDNFGDLSESTIDLELNSPDPLDDNGINMKLFGMDSDGDMEKLWSLDTESNNWMQSDLEDILEEQNRQEDLWLRQYFSVT